MAEKRMSEKLLAAVVLGRRGGEARARKLSKAERRAIGRRGAEARWRKVNKSVPRPAGGSC